MQLKSFRVRKFRNIEDSGEVKLNSPLTCVVGKNQSGKSALLRALHKFNPHQPEPYDMRRDWPRGQRTSRSKEQVVCEARFSLAQDETAALNLLIGGRPNLAEEDIVITKNYFGAYECRLVEDPERLPNPQQPERLEAVCRDLPKPPEVASSHFRQVATKCLSEVVDLLKTGRFEKLSGRTRYPTQHAAHSIPGGPRLRRRYSPGFHLHGRLQELPGPGYAGSSSCTSRRCRRRAFSRR